jgi:exonuclease III
VRSKKDGFKWEVVVVYGHAHHDKSEAFLELSNKCQRTRVPIVIGGDFNLIRCAEDNNNDHKLESSEDVQ